MSQDQTTIQRKADLKSDIKHIQSQVDDGLLMGDSMFGKYAHIDVASKVTQHMEELQKKKDVLEKEIAEKEAIVQRANRDFSDVKDTLPETQEKQRIRFVEDYTVMFVVLSYVFMVLSAIIFYVTLSEQKMMALAKALGYALFGTMMSGFLLYFIA